MPASYFIVRSSRSMPPVAFSVGQYAAFAMPTAAAAARASDHVRRSCGCEQIASRIASSSASGRSGACAPSHDVADASGADGPDGTSARVE